MPAKFGCEATGTHLREQRIWTFSGPTGDKEKLSLPCSADREKDWQPHWFMPSLLYVRFCEGLQGRGRVGKGKEELQGGSVVSSGRVGEGKKEKASRIG